MINLNLSLTLADVKLVIYICFRMYVMAGSANNAAGKKGFKLEYQQLPC